jgi:hypothetical protein
VAPRTTSLPKLRQMKMITKQFHVAFPPLGKVGDSFLPSVNIDLMLDRTTLAKNIESNLRNQIIKDAEFDGRQLICKIGNQQFKLFVNDGGDAIDFELTDSTDFLNRSANAAGFLGNLDRIKLILPGATRTYLWEPQKIIQKLIGSKVALFNVSNRLVALDIGNAVALIVRPMLIEECEGRFLHFEFDVEVDL